MATGSEGWKEVGKISEHNIAPFWGGSKITADGDCSHEIERHLLLGRKVMTNLDIKNLGIKPRY